MIKLLVTYCFCLAFLLNLKAQTTYQNEIKMEYTEIAKFKLKEGFTTEQFLDAEREVRAGIIKDAKGYISRELFKNSDNEWVILLRFDNKENLENFLASLKRELHASFRNYASMIDFSTMRMEFYNKQI